MNKSSETESPKSYFDFTVDMEYELYKCQAMARATAALLAEKDSNEDAVSARFVLFTLEESLGDLVLRMDQSSRSYVVKD